MTSHRSQRAYNASKNITVMAVESRSATLNALRATMAMEQPIEWFPGPSYSLATRRPTGR